MGRLDRRRFAAALALAFCPAPAQEIRPVIGEALAAYDLPGLEIKGLAFAGAPPRLHVLAASGRLHLFDPAAAPDRLLPRGELEIPAAADGTRIASPRGLAADGGTGFFALGGSRLWHFVPGGGAAWIDLAAPEFGIGDRQLLAVARQGELVLVAYDATVPRAGERRVRRGVAALQWPAPPAGRPALVRHLPDAGTAPSFGLAAMALGGAAYLWGTVGKEHLYAADGATGRGLFCFRAPGAGAGDGLACSGEELWVAEAGKARIHRLNAARNPFAAAAGPRRLRRLVMTIHSRPEGDEPRPGKVFHWFSRPYELPNQGIWAATEKILDLAKATNAASRHLTFDPAGDQAARQHMALVEYADAPAREYSSRYEIDLWTRDHRTFVFPHLADRNAKALAGTDYLADDGVLYNLADKGTYERFLDRVQAYIATEYGVPADMDNPYWAARNILEYIQDHYYYPVREVGKPAAVDYDRAHYDANPGNLKIALTERPYDQSQIIACSGTSVMVAGAMRFLGVPARWLGTAMQKGPAEWDRDADGLLDENETAPCTNGHRVTQVWLGPGYGWSCFDATPSRPPGNDFGPPPPAQPQWRFMERAGAGLRNDHCLVLNVGSAFFPPLYREFEYDPRRAPDNDCGGDQRYNLQGRYEKAALWKLPGHRIQMANSCFITGVETKGPREKTAISWKLAGAWDRDPGAKVSVVLQQRTGRAGRLRDVRVLAAGVPARAGRATADLSGLSGPGWRLLIRKDGDPETGGHSEFITL